MNIEQYINLDSALVMIGFVGLLVIMVIYFGFRVASFLLERQYESATHEDIDEDEEPPKQLPQAGQIWYPRMEVDLSWLAPSPWPDKDKPSVRILERRYEWVKYAEEGSDENQYAFVHDFTKKFMQNEFGDIVEVTVATPEPEPEVKPFFAETEEMPPIPQESDFNVIKIHGEDFILKPINKTENE